MVAGEVLVLWDVDRTLINAGGLSTHLYGIVFAELFGRELPQVAPMAGRTDRAIIVETLAAAGIARPRDHVPAFIAELTRQAPAFGERVRKRGRVLAGVPEALAALAGAGRGGGGVGVGGVGVGVGVGGVGVGGRVWQSVLTGNIRPLAEVKLAALGLGAPLDLSIGAYGDIDEVRAELVRVARERASAVAGPGARGFDGAATVLVGDTPLDVAAALATGARAVGVATGSFTEAELAAAGADVVLPDLADTGRVRAAILGGAR
jgi:phosphoglycolate phosphatase